MIVVARSAVTVEGICEKRQTVVLAYILKQTKQFNLNTSVSLPSHVVGRQTVEDRPCDEATRIDCTSAICSTVAAGSGGLQAMVVTHHY